MYADEMTDQAIADELALTRQRMRAAAGTSAYAGLKEWAKALQAEQYQRSITRAREVLVEGLTGLIGTALAAGVKPEDAQADIDAVCSIQLDLAEPEFPSITDYACGAYRLLAELAGDREQAVWTAEQTTVVQAEFDDASGEMESAGYPAGQ